MTTESTEFYVVRYLPGVPLRERKHVHTGGRFPDFESAESHRLSTPVAALLDVERREVAQ